MSCGKKAAAQIALLMAGIAMLCFGVWRGEAATVLQGGSRVDSDL